MFWALIGVGIAFGGLILSVLILMLKVGGLVGTLQTEIAQNSKNISILWNHQRSQDDKISLTQQAIASIDSNIRWIKNALEEK